MKNMLLLNVNVVISDVSGYVKVGMCDCKASALGRCAHATALLLKLSDAAHDKGSMIKPSHHNQAHGIEVRNVRKNLSNYMKLNTAQANVNHLLSCIMRDPTRPENLRCVKNNDIKNLVVDLQADNNPSMWVTLVSTTYDDFKLEQSDITIDTEIWLCNTRRGFRVSQVSRHD